MGIIIIGKTSKTILSMGQGKLTMNKKLIQTMEVLLGQQLTNYNNSKGQVSRLLGLKQMESGKNVNLSHYQAEPYILVNGKME